jgi:hypothetical protein
MGRAEDDGATDAIGGIPSGEDARGDAVALALRWLRADDVDIADENISVAPSSLNSSRSFLSSSRSFFTRLNNDVSCA